MNISKSLITCLTIVFMSFFAFGTAHAFQVPSVKAEPLVTKVHLYKGKYDHDHYKYGHKHVVKCVLWKKDYFGNRYCAKIKKSWKFIKRYDDKKRYDGYKKAPKKDSGYGGSY